MKGENTRGEFVLIILLNKRGYFAQKVEAISLQHLSYPQFTIPDTDGSKSRRNHA